MTWQRVLVLTGGLLLLLAAGLINPTVMTWLYAPDGEIGVQVRQRVQLVQLTLFGLGVLVLLARWELVDLLQRAPVDRAVRRVYGLRPTLSAALPALPAPLAMALGWAGVVQLKEQFPLDHLLPWLVLLQSGLARTAWFLALGLGVRRLGKVAVVLFVLGWVSLRGLDVLSLLHGHTLFQWEYLRLVRAESVWAFADSSAVVLLLTVMALVVVGSQGLWRARGVAWRWALLALVLVLVRPVDQLARIWRLPMQDYVLREVAESMQQRLDYVTRDPFYNLVLQAKAQRIEPVPLANFAEVVVADDLPLGPRDYPALPVVPFDRVVLLLTESLSLDLLAPYNPTLPVAVSPLYASLAPKMSRAHHTAATPTLNGTTALVTSHPNAPLMRAASYPDSLVRLFAAHGFHTLSLRADSRFFYNNDLENERMGYQRWLNREDLERDGATCVNRWGVCDRVLYRRLLEELDTDEPLFVTVIGVDTHPLTGRAELDYAPLHYPPTPEVPGVGSRGQALYESIFRHDHDVAWFLSELESRGIWDERTLVVLTADHASPLNNLVQGLPGYPQDPLARMPLALLTPQTLPERDLGRPSSTLDLAPTLAHLQGWSVPPGWWGDSIFLEQRRSPAVGRFRDTLYLWRSEGTQPVDLQGGDPLAPLFSAVLQP